MHENKRKAIILSALARIFNFEFDEAIAAIYLGVLESISSDQLNQVVTQGLRLNRWKFMPKPGEFLTLGESQILDDSRDSAHLCWAAIGQHGRLNPAKAQEAMGELAWAVVQRMGGWNSVCEVLIEEKGIFIAQFRDLAQSLSRKSERHEFDIKPALPTPIHLKELSSSIGKNIDA